MLPVTMVHKSVFIYPQMDPQLRPLLGHFDGVAVIKEGHTHISKNNSIFLPTPGRFIIVVILNGFIRFYSFELKY